MIKLILEGDPIPKKRHRCRCINGHGSSFDPQVREDMEPMRKRILSKWNAYLDNPGSAIAQEATLLARSQTFIVFLDFYLPLNRSDPTTTVNLKLWGIIPCNEKPDFDNLAKFYTDCATGIIWPDDKLIVYGDAHKVRYSKNPRTEMVIMSKKELTIDEKQMNVFKTFSPDDLKNFISEANRLSTFLGLNEEYFKDNDSLPREPFFSEASLLLIRFASLFSDKLKKLAKLGEQQGIV